MGRANHCHFDVKREVRTVIDGEYEHPPRREERQVEFVTYRCGQDARVEYKWNRHTTNPNHVDCPACLKKMANDRLKTLGKVNLRLEPDKSVRPNSCRTGTTNKVFENDVHIGYVGYEDHKWRVYPLSYRYDLDQPRVAMNREPLAETGTAGRGHYGLDRDALGFPTKVDAMLECGVFRAAGRLKTAAEIEAARRAYHLRSVAEEKQRQQLRDTMEAERQDTLLALQEIFEKETLSNFQRTGIMNAIARLEAQAPA